MRDNHIQANLCPGSYKPGNIYSPNNPSVCSTKHCNFGERSIILG